MDGLPISYRFFRRTFFSNEDGWGLSKPEATIKYLPARDTSIAH